MVLLLLLWLGWTGCEPAPDRSQDAPDDWLAWRAKRQESLAGSNGWTTLVARHWLPDGVTFAGADPTNQLVLPLGRAPAQVGRFTRHERQVHFEAAPGVAASIDGQPARGVAALTSDVSNAPTRLVVGPLTMAIIERGDRFGVRVRDPDSPARLRFKGVDCFPYDPAWRLRGWYEPYATPRTLRVQDVLGGTQALVAPGKIRFDHAGETHRLDVVDEPGESEFFVIFRDRTAGVSTYGSGRFLYVARPGADGQVTIDFNRAYTPPCGFTPFATCPLPPVANWLPFPIPAGERSPGLK